MPTPSSNAPDSQSPRSFPFSSCPDPDEQQGAPLQSPSLLLQDQLETEPTSPPSPSSWHPRPPPPYSADAGTQVSLSMDDDTALSLSRSATMSPRPSLLPDGSRDVDMAHEPEESSHGATQVGTEEGHKQSETDEDMSYNGNEYGPSVARAVLGYYPGGSRTGAAPRAVAVAAAVAAATTTTTTTTTITSNDTPSRRKQKTRADRLSPQEELLGNATRWVEDSGLVGMGSEYSQMRAIATSPSSFLRPGSRFEGTQQSERQRYDVQVEIKHVDLRESFLCGYLRIQGLTDDHPTLTTYFEGEIIGTKYGFITQHPSWGATDKIDLNHWGKFVPFKQYSRQARKTGHVLIRDIAQRENIFMRWKEHFLVPDHRVRTINGASFEGFYYICFNQVRGEVSGIYFHSKSEKFQQLDLKHVEDKGCFGAMEFR